MNHYYHTLLSGYIASKPLYLDESTQKSPNTLKLVEQSWQQTNPELWNEAVALGFAVFENMIYSMKYGLVNFHIRQFNAVPLHIGLAAIWGMGIAKVKFLHQGNFFFRVLPYVLLAALIHSIYNYITTLFIHPGLTLFVLSVFVWFLIRFAIRKIKHYAEDCPFANRLFCHACNTVNFPDERVCKNCGEKFHLEFYVLCYKCNARVSKIATVCPRCGEEIHNINS